MLDCDWSSDVCSSDLLLAERMKTTMAPTFERYGLALDNFAVENVSLPEELQKAIDTRISMGMMGDMAKYTQYQVASSIPLAAQNEGGIAGIGAGLAAGVGMGQMMGDAMRQAMNPAAAQPAPQAAPATAPAPAAEAPEARLEKLKAMLDKGLISAADYDTAKAEILKKLIG
jgi:membrane protease subunit (stomatin/prohibitin family)